MAADEEVVRTAVVLPFLLVVRLTASLSTAVQAMNEAQAARPKKMVSLDNPVSAGGQQQQGAHSSGGNNR
jgi:hypothetical protein